MTRAQRAQVVELGTVDLGTLLFCAMRYAYGRQTYIVDDIVRIVREHFDQCTTEERRNLVRDLGIELHRSSERHQLLGDERSHRQWTELWIWMAQQQELVEDLRVEQGEWP